MKKQIIINETDFLKARKKIREAQKQKSNNKDLEIIFSSKDDELNRKILEKEKIDVFLPPLLGRRDFHKQRDSGFNQVMARLAKKNNVALGIDLDEIFQTENKEKAEILARISQNIRLCNKNKLKMVFISTSGRKIDSYNVRSLGLILGMPTWMINI